MRTSLTTTHTMTRNDMQQYKSNIMKFKNVVIATVLVSAFSMLIIPLGNVNASAVVYLGDTFFVIPVDSGNQIELVRLEIAPHSPTPDPLEIGQKLQYKAIAVLGDSSRVDITDIVDWESSNTLVANISNQPSTKGLATASSAGNTHITAFETATGTVSNQQLLQVQEVFKLVRLEISPDAPPGPLEVGQVLQYNAIAVLGDNSRVDITGMVSWRSSNIFVARISNQSPTKGLATGSSVGSARITAYEPTTGTVSNQQLLLVQEIPIQVCHTVAEILRYTHCLGLTVSLTGYVTERIDSDDYTFYDGTGEIRIEYEGELPLFRLIEITGRMASEFDVSSFRVL